MFSCKAGGRPEVIVVYNNRWQSAPLPTSPLEGPVVGLGAEAKRGLAASRQGSKQSRTDSQDDESSVIMIAVRLSQSGPTGISGTWATIL